MKAVVLAGGKSSRMGENKALLQLQGETFISKIGKTLSTVCPKVYISGQDTAYNALPYPQIPDIYTEKGPLGGIYSALAFLRDDILVCSCDMPFIAPKVLQYLLSQVTPQHITVLSYQQKIFPVVGYYPYALLTNLEMYINQDMLKMQVIIKELNAKVIDYPNEDTLAFTNINTPQQWALINNTK